MQISNIQEHDRYKYSQTCLVCEMECVVLTQKDSFPEYYTNVYVQCSCGEYLHFELPVN